MVNKKSFAKLTAICLAMVAMILAESLSVSASAPSKEKVSYLGSGKVEVDFLGDVEYRKPKVTVKDASGKKYKASIYKLDDDEIKFKIKNYKAGKKYKFTITGIREEYTSKYGKVKGKVTIKKESKKNISLKKAKNIAINDAVKRYQVSKNQVTYLHGKKDWEDGVAVYEVEFLANNMKYEYVVSIKGKILERDRDLD